MEYSYYAGDLARNWLSDVKRRGFAGWGAAMGAAYTVPWKVGRRRQHDPEGAARESLGPGTLHPDYLLLGLLRAHRALPYLSVPHATAPPQVRNRHRSAARTAPHCVLGHGHGPATRIALLL